MLHPQERIAQVVARHAALLPHSNDVANERRGIGWMEDDARKQGAAVGCCNDPRFEQRRILPAQGEDFAPDVVTLDDEERRARYDVASDAMRSRPFPSEDRTMRTPQAARPRTFAP